MVWLGEYANNINGLSAMILACAWFVQSWIVVNIGYSRDAALSRSMAAGSGGRVTTNGA
jgi:hypothetical protein